MTKDSIKFNNKEILLSPALGRRGHSATRLQLGSLPITVRIEPVQIVAGAAIIWQIWPEEHLRTIITVIVGIILNNNPLVKVAPNDFFSTDFILNLRSKNKFLKLKKLS